MKKRFFLIILMLSLLQFPVKAAGKYIRWVDFNVEYEALRTAMEMDIESRDTEKPLSWIRILALAATRCGGSGLSVKAVKDSRNTLLGDTSLKKLLGKQWRTHR